MSTIGRLIRALPLYEDSVLDRIEAELAGERARRKLIRDSAEKLVHPEPARLRPKGKSFEALVSHLSDINSVPEIFLQPGRSWRARLALLAGRLLGLEMGQREPRSQSLRPEARGR